MKKIGFLSFGHWTASAQSATRSARDVLLQSIDLAVAAEQPAAVAAVAEVAAQSPCTAAPATMNFATFWARVSPERGAISDRTLRAESVRWLSHAPSSD